MKAPSLVLSAVVALFVSTPGCADEAGNGGSGGAGGSGGSSPTEQGLAMCRALGSLCHAVDDGGGPLADCHDLGHVGDPVACAEGFEACVTLCLEAESGGVAGAAGRGGEPGHMPGSALCEFIGSYCHEVDDGDGPLHACHELGHTADPVACGEQAESCIDLCAEARQGAGGEGGAGGGGS